MDSNYITNGNVNAEQATELTKEPSIMDSALYYHLFYEAEKVRWKMSDIPWSAIEKDKVTPSLVSLVRDIAYAELTTWSATNRFFEAFAEDVDFSQWITVWLYEETKHPQVLMRWLKEFGESFDANFLLEGRKTHPFMQSRMGTLVMNILSEIEVSSVYLGISDIVEEPVLKRIFCDIAADEARHASSFYSYSKKMIDESDKPDFERFEVIKVLHFWLTNKGKVKHPVALLTNHVSNTDAFDAYHDQLSRKVEKAYARMRMMIGNLIGRALEDNDGVATAFRELYAVNKLQAN